MFIVQPLHSLTTREWSIAFDRILAQPLIIEGTGHNDNHSSVFFVGTIPHQSGYVIMWALHFYLLFCYVSSLLSLTMPLNQKLTRSLKLTTGYKTQ